MKNIVIFGAGQHARAAIHLIEKENKYKIVGLTHPELEIGTDILGYKVIGRQEDIVTFSKKYDIEGGIIAIGDNWTRKIVYEKVSNLFSGFSFVSAIHPNATIARDVKIGKGSIIMAGAVLDSSVTIGDFCFVHVNSFLGHDCKMDDFSSISMGVVFGGCSSLGKYSAVSLGAIIFDRINIGEHVVVGGGALVTKGLPDYVVAYGVPAKIVRKRKAGEKYLKGA